MKPEGILSNFPYKGPNSTSSSLPLNTCWVSCPGGGLRLKQDGAQKDPPSSLKHMQKTHICRHTNPNNLQACAHRCAPHVSLGHRWMHVCRVMQTLFFLPVGSPSQSDMATERRGSGQCLLLSAEFLQPVASPESVPPFFCFAVPPIRLFYALSCQTLSLFSFLTLVYLLVLPPSLPLSLSPQSDQWPVDVPIKDHTSCYWTLNL